jgi:hypothetical protein
MEIGPVQQKIAGVMFLILALCLALMSYTTYNAKYAAFPPIINQCPDFYTLEGTTCMRPASYPVTAPEKIEIGTGIYSDKNSNSLCKKKRWAKLNSITWDGITNNEMIVKC